MAEGSREREMRESNFLSPAEEGYIRDMEEQGDADQQLVLEKELAAQRLWQSFQESATAVAHLFRGLSCNPLHSIKHFSHYDFICLCSPPALSVRLSRQSRPVVLDSFP